jgi:anti-sigma B factor antagonist
MDMRVSELGDATLVVLSGRLNTAGVSAIETRFTAAVVPKARPTVVDLSEVDFMASLGIRLLLSTARALGSKGAKLTLFGASPQLVEVIEMTSLQEIIPLSDTQDEALALAKS